MSGVKSGERAHTLFPSIASFYTFARTFLRFFFSSWEKTCASLPRPRFWFSFVFPSWLLTSFPPKRSTPGIRRLLVLSVRGKRLSGLCVKATGSDSRSSLDSVPPSSHLADSLAGQLEEGSGGSEDVIGAGWWWWGAVGVPPCISLMRTSACSCARKEGYRSDRWL